MKVKRWCDISTAQALVAKFHKAAGLPVLEPIERRPIGIQDPAMRANLIEEEAHETVEAILAGDLVGAVDGLCDLIYVCLGAAEIFNVDLYPFFEEVHRSNMTKVPFERRADGKVLKGPNFSPPDIAGELCRQGWQG